VGKEEIGREEGFPRDRDVWARAVLRCLDPLVLAEVRRGLVLLGLERCLDAGTWVAPPETPEAWLLRQWERAGNPPEMPAIPPVPGPSDPALLERLFPGTWTTPEGSWNLDWDPWKGKVGCTGPKGVKPKFPLPPGWKFR
jgi:hypothetical protein